MEIKYRVVAKVGNLPNGQAKRITYLHVNNLSSFARFLDREHPTWAYMNVFDREWNRLASFTKKAKPLFAKIPEGFSQSFEKTQPQHY
ncbi:MAG: hypothetical protein ABJH04_07780 [Cyclobacteriaceae bacterium]